MAVLNPIQLGHEVRDVVTGFTGIATSRVVYLNGCVQYGITPPIDKEGKRQEVVYIDSQQLQYEGEGVTIGAKETGGDMPDVPSC